MHFRSILCGAALSLASLLPVTASELKQRPAAVLELFTSQGCASCPKADALLSELGKRSDIIALAYHVDYWDYIGWADTFGTKQNSDLQRDYAQSWGSSRIFTPQLVVNGAAGVVAGKQDIVRDAVNDAATLPLEVSLTEHEHKTLDVSIPAHAGLKPGVVWLVTFHDRAEVAIERGLNKGKNVAYSQIVTGRQVLGMWDPASGAHLKLPLSEVLSGRSNGAVIMVQQENDDLPGPILGAASFTL